MKQHILIAVRVDPDILQALRDIKAEDGIPVNEQIRRGIQLWLDQKQRPGKKSKK